MIEIKCKPKKYNPMPLPSVRRITGKNPELTTLSFKILSSYKKIIKTPMEKRQPFLWSMIGHTGTGKTSTAVQMCKDWKKAYKGKKIIGFDPHDILRREKLIDYYISARDENWAEIIMTQECNNCNRTKDPQKERCTKCGKSVFRYKFANSLLVLDDYRSLLQSDKTPSDFMDLLMLRRRIGIDIIYICHNPKLIHVRLAYFTTHYSIFYTESHAADFSDKIPKYADCQKAANLVNQYVLSYGRGAYPDFPYAIVRPETNDELELMNIDPQKVAVLKAGGKI